jgi:hypothetical protein
MGGMSLLNFQNCEALSSSGEAGAAGLTLFDA